MKKSRRLKKKRYKDIFFYSILAFLVLGFSAFLIISNLRIYQKRRELKAQIERLKEEIQAIEKKNQELRTGIENISDKEYLEKVAREKFLLKEEGEEVIVISPPEEQAEEPQPEKESFFEKILEKLKSLLF